MKTVLKWTVSAVVLLLSQQAIAQSVSVGTGLESGVAGDSFAIPVTFVAGADITGVDFDITFPDSEFNSESASCAAQTACPGAFLSCDIDPAGNANIILAASSACSNGLLGVINLTIDGAATAGPKALDLTVAGLSDSNGMDLPLDTITVNDGQITVLGPAYTSSPVPGIVDLGSVIQNDTDLQTDVSVSNTGAAGSSLAVTCSELNDTGNVFTISPDTEFTVSAGSSSNVTVSCDSAGAITTHTAQMSCAHDGDDGGESSPAVYDLSCTITAGPQPAYASVPTAGTAINLVATNEGDPITPATVTISNSGDVATTLTGTCAFVGMAPSQLSVVDGAFSVDQGGAPDVQTISCDSSDEGIYSATLSCSHNGSNASPVTYPVSCDVGPQREAVFASTPVPGTTTDMTGSFPNGEAVVGDVVPDSILTIRNEALAGARDLGLVCSETMPGVAGITASPNGGALDVFLAPGDSTQVTFSCDTQAAGSYTYAYQCDYVEDGGEAPTGQASYTYTCDVREPESVVDPTPASGTPLSGVLPPGGSATLQVVFGETNDEGADGTLEGCTLADGANFVITSPAFPATIPSGGTLPVVVEGTDPGGVDSISDTLNCTYTDSANDSPPAAVSYPLLLTVGGSSGFTVTKTFTDGSTDEVDVTLTCNGGLPLEQSFTIAGGGPGVTFVVTNLESGPTCEVTESGGPDGYTAIMNDGAGCVFEDVQPGGEYTCAIVNAANPGMFTVTKEWIVSEVGAGEEVNQVTDLIVWCDKEILGGEGGSVGDVPTEEFMPYGYLFEIVGDGFVTAYVDTSTGPANCTATEGLLYEVLLGFDESGVETITDCPQAIVSVDDELIEFTDPSTWIPVEAGGEAGCGFVNTVFFEGIPTLSQWGMAIMALLMLGMGMIGFRRFA